MQRIALYVRVSTEEQVIHGLSIEAQTLALDEWAKSNKHKVVNHYIDAGISARKKAIKRPSLQRLLADIRAGEIDLVVFTKLDRWFRNIAEYYKVQEVLEAHHVDWKTIHEDYDTTTSSGRLKINIMLSVAQDEADRTSERIKVVFDAKRARREPLTGNTPTGYRIEGKSLIKDEALEPTVSAFFHKFLQCGSISETQDFIREEYNYRIEYQLASKMLHSPAYYGFYYGVEDMSPAYLSKEDFDKIQGMRTKIVRKTKENRIYLFSGIAVCGECGYRLGGRCNNGRNVNSPFYNCSCHYVKKACDNGVNLVEKKIEAYLMDTIGQKLSQFKIDFQTLRERRSEKNYQSEISSVKSKLSKLKDLYLNDLISLDEYKADKERFSAALDALISKSYAVEPDFSKIDRLLVAGWQDTYSALDKLSQREFWRMLTKEIRVYKDRHIEYDLLT